MKLIYRVYTVSFQSPLKSKLLINTVVSLRCVCVFMHYRVTLQTHFITLQPEHSSKWFLLPLCLRVQAWKPQISGFRVEHNRGGISKSRSNPFFILKTLNESTMQWLPVNGLKVFCILLHHASTCPRRSLSNQCSTMPTCAPVFPAACLIWLF